MLDRDPATDEVLRRDDFHCVYCGADLLADVRSFVLIVRDHLRPRGKHGSDREANRVASCAACDRLKGGRGDGTLAEARRIVAKRWQLAEAEFARVGSCEGRELTRIA